MRLAHLCLLILVLVALVSIHQQIPLKWFGLVVNDMYVVGVIGKRQR
jgi:hypothetical protein